MMKIITVLGLNRENLDAICRVVFPYRCYKENKTLIVEVPIVLKVRDLRTSLPLELRELQVEFTWRVAKFCGLPLHS